MRSRSSPRLRSASVFTLVASCLAGPLAASSPSDPLSEGPLPLPASITWTQDGHGHHAGHVHATGWEPAGVMAGHPHEKGEWMLSYRYMLMDMDGNRDGTDRLSESDVFGEGYMVTPLDMQMQMHMFGGMYGLTDDWTLMAMVPYLELEMDHVTGTGVEFTTKSSGIGDVKLGALYTFWRSGFHQAHFHACGTIPTGSIDEEDETPASGGNDVQLPYPMQLGSGTFDLLPGVTYLGHDEEWSWGAQGIQTIRTGENDNDYKLGSRTDVTVWAGHDLTDTFTATLRGNASFWSNIHGADRDLNPAVVPTADPKRRAGSRIDLLGGIDWHHESGNRLALEVGFPVYQNLDGPQLETDLVLTVSWQFLR